MSYDYGEKNGPHTWVLRYPNAGGTKQSPINLNTTSMRLDKTLTPINVNLNDLQKQILHVKEHNFSVEVKGCAVLSGGPLTSEYKLAQFHLHWGSGNNWGSEHMINGISCPAELHCVFINTKYGTMETAITYSDGLSVVGVFFQLGKSSNNNNALKRLCTLLKTTKKGESKDIQPMLDLNTLLPNDLSRYYTYSGSLTTPPCNECVTWIVLDEPVVMTIDQLETLRQMHANCVSCGQTDNFRPICPVGSRSVRCSFQV
ncbi:Carbonic anhydrase 2 isoform 3 [Schistosoma japonicum]|uniref:carbonic anhydrase n=1 Tax=Schistosoma japonicum TaxID=6182 RepID=C1LFK7_SCHJA|nr:Carbonic anhydrase 2 isoform 3 [Schistosoma japonicum]CAX73485.1 putative carbonic anhydrase II [Schistosoma japonicum]